MSFPGTVKIFNPMKGFGFVTNAEGIDIFLHIKACTDGGVPQVGDVVMYDLEESKIKPGQMQCSNVTGGTGTPAEKGAGKGGGGASTGTGSSQGSVKSFNAEKGFGFITPANGAENIFFHQKQMTDGSTPQQGDYLSFDTEPSPIKPGQMQACNISGGTGWGKGAGGKGGGGGGGASWGAAPAADAWSGGGQSWGGGGGDSWDGGGKSFGAAKGGDSWGGGKSSPYGGGKGGKDDGGKGQMMAQMMSMMGGGGGGGGDGGWGGGGGGGGGGDSWKGGGW